MTTTGFSVTDYNGWPTLALMTIVGLMFVGGSAGSTTGSVKVVRHLLVGKLLRREIDQTLHPELVLPVRLNRRVVEERTLRAVSSFVLLYIGIFVIGAAVLALDRTHRPRSLGSRRVPVSASICNVGPAFGIADRSARRAVQRRLDARDDRPDVARRLETFNRRPALTPLLAQR